jgi:hypothetical protein
MGRLGREGDGAENKDEGEVSQDGIEEVKKRTSMRAVKT